VQKNKKNQGKVWKFTIQLERIHGHMQNIVKNVKQKNPKHMKVRKGV
jgi:hypothetical protein